MSKNNSKLSKSSHWDKILKHTNNLKNKCNSKNKNDDYEQKIEVNNTAFSEVIDIDKENLIYIDNTKNILKLANIAYVGILTEISNFRMKLIELNEVLKFRKEYDENDPTFITKSQQIAKKEYDDLLIFLYQNLLNFIKMKLVSNYGNNCSALFESGTDDYNVRNVTLTYMTRSGIVIDNSIAKIDNVRIDYDSLNKLILSIGNYKIKILKSIGIKHFTVIKLREYIIQVLNNLYSLEKEIEKNIKLISHSFETINAIKENLGL